MQHHGNHLFDGLHCPQTGLWIFELPNSATPNKANAVTVESTVLPILPCALQTTALYLDRHWKVESVFDYFLLNVCFLGYLDLPPPVKAW